MGTDGAYVLKGYGQIESDWILLFFALFKQQRVNIRKLILLQNGRAGSFAMLEVHFIPPCGEGQAPFLQELEQHLSLQNWQAQSLRLL